MESIKEEIMNLIEIKKLTESELRKSMHIRGKDAVTSFNNALNELEVAGTIYLDEDGYYKNFDVKQLGKVQGQIHINKTGYGFVFVGEGKSRVKYLINKDNINGALDGDIVVLTSIHQGKINYADAIVEKIVKRNKGQGIFEYQDNELIPCNIAENIRVICPKEELKKLVAGSRALVNLGKEVTLKVDNKLIFEGNILKIIGHKDDPDIEVQTIASFHGFYKDFPPAVLKQLDEIPNYVLEEEYESRVDLTLDNIFTIDGKDTKDIDDAISIKKLENGDFILSVHIADVSHYVKEGTPLYEEAKKRGTSAYLANSVIPMLPHKLSNGICSLNENEDRLTKTVSMYIDSSGKIIDYEIYDSVICSKKKMNYDDVNKILEENVVPLGYEDFVNDLNYMKELSSVLTKQRKTQGKIDFYSDEVKVVTEATGIPITFEKRHQNTAERLIENFMIAANECVAEYHFYLDIPFVYRVHGDPNEDNLICTLKKLKEEHLCDKKIIDSLLNKIQNSNFHSKDLDEFLKNIRDDELFPIISNMLLKCMSKAKYSVKDEGHYGLSLKNYTHFTSPIRRFPDLQVHTLINEYKTYENIPKILGLEPILIDICNHSSLMEREADDAERETLDLKMAEYMQNHINEIYCGRIISMTPYDNVIKLDNNIIGHVTPQDLIHAKKVRHNEKIKLGSKVYVLVKDVSISQRLIYFSLAYKELSKSKVKRII